VRHAAGGTGGIGGGGSTLGGSSVSYGGASYEVLDVTKQAAILFETPRASALAFDGAKAGGVTAKSAAGSAPLVDKAFVLSIPGKGAQRLADFMRHPLWKHLDAHGHLEVFPAVDGTKPGAVSLRDVNRGFSEGQEHTNFSDGERGIMQTWVNLARTVVDRKLHRVMVLEDDATNLNSLFGFDTAELIQETPADADQLLLGYGIWRTPNYKDMATMRTELHKQHVAGTRNVYKVGDYVLQHAVILTASGAKKILESLPMHAPIEPHLLSIPGFNTYRHGNELSVKAGDGSDAFVSALIGQNGQEKSHLYETSAKDNAHQRAGHTLIYPSHDEKHSLTMRADRWQPVLKFDKARLQARK